MMIWRSVLSRAYNAAGVNMDDVLIIGIDGLEAGAGYIKEGTLDATVGRDLDKETSMYLDVCEKLVAGEPVEEEDRSRFFLYPGCF